MRTVIGITGKIGAGKTTIVEYLASSSFVDVFDCDEEVREIYDDPNIQAKLIGAFGTTNRDEIRELLIKEQDLTKLEASREIFADVINTRFTQWVSGRKGIIVVDAPLLFENAMDVLCDITIQLSAPANIRRDRVMDRSPTTAGLFGLLNALQLSDEVREMQADHTIHTYPPLTHVYAELNKIINPLLPTVAIYAGSFDPVTRGHVDIIEKASAMFDILVVAVGINPDKTHTLDSKMRMELVDEETQHIHNIRIECYSDTLLAAARRTGATYIVRGIRNEADVINEISMSGIHNAADPTIQTIFIPADPKYQYVSSSAAKVLLQSHRSNDPIGVVDVSWMISDNVKHKLMAQQIHDYNNRNSVTTLT